MTDNFLRDAVENQRKNNSKRRIVKYSILVAVISFAVTGIIISVQNADVKTATEPVVSQGSDSKTSNVSSAPVSNPSQKPTQPQSSKNTGISQNATSSTSAPQTKSINKSLFIADAKSVVSNYNEIVGLVTFTQSQSTSYKIGQISKAKNLDSSYFSNAAIVRAHLVAADVNDGPYMDATNMLGSGVSSISVGVYSLDRWAKDNTRNIDLESGLNSIEDGSEKLLQLLTQLDNL